MKSALDSSVIIAALCDGFPEHEACRKALLSGRHSVLPHAFAETFSTLTGGRLGFRLPASDASDLIRKRLVPKLRCIAFDADDLLATFDEAQARGVRGGAIYDYLHLAAARKAGAKRFFTLNLADFHSFHRPGDPEILSP
ncbi:MAG: PIN domain-containing protein [Luteolibacter sp.]|uniref:PIN domain-containing protein n=1 Tax=Luteolibacter sp. TaxID=1962973 RepID=UPI0032634524